MGAGFGGFPEDAPRFLGELAKNNNKAWFEANKGRYIEGVKAPAEEFARALSARMQKTFPGLKPLCAKVFRIHRDIRFSHDKTPYKTHIGIRFSGEGGKGCSLPFFYVQIEAGRLWLVTGIKAFERQGMDAYRRTLADTRQAARLARLVAGLKEKGLEPGGEKTKRLPPGLNADGPAAELGKHKGLYVEESLPRAAVLHQPELVDYCVERFKRAKPLYDWLGKL